jgi:molybdopterin-guanine dinucleotide biosynthesis protein B
MKVFGIAGYSGAGKTTLIEKLLAELCGRGLAVSVVKQSHHDVTLDPPGKDSWRHRQAGAREVLLTSPHRWMLAVELRGAPEPTLTEHIRRLADCDLVLVEGYRHADLPKLEVHRTATGQPWLHPDDPNILALASDAAAGNLPCFALDDSAAIANFILEHARHVER